MPFCFGCSSRAPALTQTPSATVSSSGMARSRRSARSRAAKFRRVHRSRALPDTALDGTEFVRPGYRTAPASPSDRASRGGSAGRTPQAASTASGNFAGWAVASTTIGVSRQHVPSAPTWQPTAVCGSTSSPVSRERPGDLARRLRSMARALNRTPPGSVRSAASAMMKRRDCPKLAHQRGAPPARRARELEQQPLEIRSKPGCPSTGSTRP